MITQMRAAVLGLVLLGAAAWATASDEPETAGLAPEVWVNEGDTDGDGLSDAFEIRHGLDPRKAATYADSTADEDRVDASGRTMFELQKAEQDAAAGTGDDGGGSTNCGATGLEVALVLALAALRKRF